MTVYFHIGMPRAGSTSLQLNLFSRPDLFVQYGEPNAPRQPWHKAGLGVPYVEEPSSGLSVVKDEMIQCVRQQPDRTFVVSDESFLSVNTRLSDQELFAQRLHSLGFNTKVLLIVRRQEDIIISRYRQLQTLKAWSALGFPFLKVMPVHPACGDLREVASYPRALWQMPSFSEWLEMGLAGIYGNWFSNLFYDRVYDYYSSSLGDSNVTVLTYENYRRDVHQFACDLAEHYSLPVETIKSSLTGKQWNRSADRKWERVLTPSRANGLGVVNTLRLYLHQLQGTGGLVPKLSHSQKGRIQRIFGESNKRLCESAGIDLGASGYTVS